jgi:hypothetical protein
MPIQLYAHCPKIAGLGTLAVSDQSFVDVFRMDARLKHVNAVTG